MLSSLQAGSGPPLDFSFEIDGSGSTAPALQAGRKDPDANRTQTGQNLDALVETVALRAAFMAALRGGEVDD
jgi:hypothetical protein